MPVDPALAGAAINRIRKQVQGNGLKPSSVNLKSLDGREYNFYATTSVKLVPSVKENVRAGRYNDGDIIAAGQIKLATTTFIDRIAADRGVLGLVYETLASRPDQGFGLKNTSIDLPQVSRRFVAHDACQNCHGSGGAQCYNCQGQMRIQCYRCHGNGGVSCTSCQGRGFAHTPQGQTTCHNCQGRGMTPCPICHAERLIQCPECQGIGKRTCEPCHGLGWQTRTWNVTLSASTEFHIRKTGLPPALVTLIERVGGARLASDGHARVRLLEGTEAAHLARFADAVPGTNLWFLYQARMPYAALEISFGKATLTPKLAGYKARLVEVPDFMDALIKPGMTLLHDAARGGAGASQLILSAARYRLLGDVLRGMLRGSARKMMQILAENYPLGLSQNAAQSIVRDANGALSRLSLWPRTMAMAISLGVSSLILAAYFLYGGRDQAMANLQTAPSLTIYGFDACVVGLLGFGGFYAIRASARKAMRSVMEGLGVLSGGSLPLPKAGAPGIWYILGLCGITVLFIFVSGLLKL